jgi:hypothetical protein
MSRCDPDIARILAELDASGAFGDQRWEAIRVAWDALGGHIRRHHPLWPVAERLLDTLPLDDYDGARTILALAFLRVVSTEPARLPFPP